MAKKLKRRSLRPAGVDQQEALTEEQVQTTVTPAAQEDNPGIETSFLTSIPGIGKVVAERVLELTPTVDELFTRWANAGSFASEVKGLSPAGASKIWDAARDAWPHLAPGGTQEASKVTQPVPSTVAPTIEPAPPAEAAENEPLVSTANGGSLPVPYNSFTDEQLRALLPTLTEPVLSAVQRHLEGEEKDPEPPPLPDGFESFNPEQLSALSATLKGEVAKQVSAYLAFVYSSSDTAYGADDEPEENQEPVVPVPQTITQAAPVPPKPALSTGVLGFFKQETQRYASGGGGGKTPFLKMTGGKNVLRLLGPYKHGAAPFRVFKAHTWRANNRVQFGLDFNWIRSDDEYARYLLNEGKITEQDMLAAREHGDPMQELPLRLSAQDRKDEAKNLWARTRYLWNVIDRATGELKVWESSKTFFDQIAMFDEEGSLIGGLLSIYPDLFDNATGRDIQVNGNGQEGTARRYSAPMALEPSLSGIEDDARRYDLDAVVSRKAKSWEEKAEAVFSLSGRLANSVGMVPNEWLGASNNY